jgi:hypothetical protein
MTTPGTSDLTTDVVTIDEVTGRWADVREGDHEEVRAAVRDSRRALVRLGGAFMTSRQLADAARPLALSPSALYFQGRSGPLGRLTPAAVTRLFGTFAPRAVEAALGGREPVVPPGTAATAFARAAAAWGTERLSPMAEGELTRLAELAEAVVDGTPADALPLVAAWRDEPRPGAPAQRAAHAAFLLRELRGALHFAALALHGLPVVQAVLADPEAGQRRLAAFGFSEPELAELDGAMDAEDRLARRAAAEQDTDDALTARVLAATSSQDALELTRLLDAGCRASRSG